ncbi:hypothetical protein T484DRAFT_1946539, partial [Baffinella frigidus]
MPTATIVREQLMEALGQQYTDKEFEDLCFEFGIELDEITTEGVMQRKEKGDKVQVDAAEGEEVVYKIDISANRYDLLCLEGMSLALNVFRGKMDVPNFRSVRPANPEKIVVAASTGQIRPYVVACVLRGINFNKARYNRFIELQDKLHENICRRRTLVAIGTHDLDTIQGPFSYEALPPTEIEFVPLNQETKMNAKDMMEFYEKDMKLKSYLHIIRDSPVYPVIYDSKRRVLSMPPIINGDHSKIKVAMFSCYCAEAFSVEDVLIEAADGTQSWTPDIKQETITATVDYVNRIVGVPLTPAQQIELLGRMQLTTVLDPDGKTLVVTIPPTRHDILQACDIAEDVAIAYGYNNVPRKFPATQTFGKQQPLNKLADLLRGEVAQAGFYEVLTFGLCSHVEAFAHMNRPDDGKTAVTLANPKTLDFEICRPSLLPGTLKTLCNGQRVPKPIKLFEITDVVLQDPASDVGASNQRHLCAIHGGVTSGFEVVHGLLDHVMTMLNVPFDAEKGYSIKEASDGAFFDGRCANIVYK